MPGFALPFIFSNTLWSPIVEDKGSLTGFMMPLSGNLEAQLINNPNGNLLFFAGPNMALTMLTLATPYHARAGVTDADSTIFTMNTTVALFGVQFGAQAGIPVAKLKLAPFFMANMESGTASFTFNHGYSGVRSLVTSSVVDIEPFTTLSYGADIIIVPWNLSIGTLLQQAAANGEQQGFKTTLFTLSWHFRRS